MFITVKSFMILTVYQKNQTNKKVLPPSGSKTLTKVRRKVLKASLTL